MNSQSSDKVMVSFVIPLFCGLSEVVTGKILSAATVVVLALIILKALDSSLEQL